MWRKLKQVLVDHWQDNLALYLVIFLIFLLGIVLGTLAVKALDADASSRLAAYLDGFLSRLGDWETNPARTARMAITANARTIAAIWFLGLTVIGAPLVIFLVWLKGFVLGFTVGFLVEEKAANGVLLAVLSVLPQNLFYVPGWILAGALAVAFSLWLWRGRSAKERGLGRAMVTYSLLMSGLVVVVVAGSAAEAYAVPWLLKMVADYL